MSAHLIHVVVGMDRSNLRLAICSTAQQSEGSRLTRAQVTYSQTPCAGSRY